MKKNKQEMLDGVKFFIETMPNSESSWLCPYYAIGRSFSELCLNNMSEQELNNLMKIACSICSNLIHLINKDDEYEEEDEDED